MSAQGTRETIERVTYTVDEARRLLGLGRASAYEAIRKGEIPVLHIGRRLLVPRAALLKMLEGRQGER
ncbi:MAG: helix-turn-helix domain-containing protein [Dehalococcoidia bacterium]|nr:helix-turn-helix domain-containing protein [Dehalococcoidia bacterium]